LGYTDAQESKDDEFAPISFHDAELKLVEIH